MDTNSCEASLEDCKGILKKHLNHENFEILNVVQNSLSNEVVGIMAGHFNIQLIYKINNRVHVTNFFEKRMMTRFKSQDKMIKQQGAFKKEAFIYETFIKKLEGIPNYDSDYLPKCYYSKLNEFFIFENLKFSNFVTCKFHEIFLDVEHCKLALDTVAKFHSATIIYEHQQTVSNNNLKYSIYDEYSEMFHDSIYRRDEKYLGYTFFTTACQAVLKLIDICTTFDNDDRENLKKIFLENADNTYELVKASTKYPNVICHGDLWTNNLLFKYENDQPVECKLIDYQAIRYTVPAHDVLCLIYSVSTTEFCNQNLETLLNHYYESLKKHLNKCNIDINDYYSYESFKESCDYVLPMVIVQKVTFSLLMSLAIHPEVFQNEDLFEKMLYSEKHKCDYSLEDYKNNDLYRNMINDNFLALKKLKPVVK